MGSLIDLLVTVPLRGVLTFFYHMLSSLGIPNYGLAIILLTLVVKLVLFPLTYKSLHSMKAMQDLQPKTQELQKKYKDDRQKLNQEIQALYRESGVNPLLGCLPMLLQMPILIGLYYAIRDYQYVPEHVNFLWVQDIKLPDAWFILPVLAAVLTYVQQKQSAGSSQRPAEESAAAISSKTMLYVMPLFVGYISCKMPAGVGLYWVVSSIFQIVQQSMMNMKAAKTAKEAG